MTYVQVKDQVLKLLNQYTVAGSPVAESYNNQADYIARIPGLINDALMEISTTVRKIEKELSLIASASSEDLGEEYRFDLPDDFLQFKSGDNFIVFRGNLFHHQAHRYLGQKCIILPKKLVEECDPVLVYYRYPILLPEDESQIRPTAALDNTLEVHRAIPYYVAGMLALHDDPFLASSLMNAYEDKLAKMQPEITAEAGPVLDAYNFHWPHYGYDC